MACVRPLRRFRPGLVGRVVQLRGRLEHALAGLGVDVSAAVERPRNRSDRDVQVARKIANIQAVRCSR